MNALATRFQPVLDTLSYPLLFLSISGAHLYGFPSPDSDYDLRGCHLVPLRDLLGFGPSQDTISHTRMMDGVEMDYVSHEVLKFFDLLLRKSGEILEQIHSPLVVVSTPQHEELRALIPALVTRHHAHHYMGLSRSQWLLFEGEEPHRVKPLLYVYRGLLTGLHLMRTGEVEANLVNLNERYALPYIPDLIARKLAGTEQGTLDAPELDFHRREFQRLNAELDAAFQDTHLPDYPTGRTALNNLLVRIRYMQFDREPRGG